MHKDRGFAYVELQSKPHAEYAVRHLNGRNICNTPAKVAPRDGAADRRANASGPSVSNTGARPESAAKVLREEDQMEAARQQSNQATAASSPVCRATRDEEIVSAIAAKRCVSYKDGRQLRASVTLERLPSPRREKSFEHSSTRGPPLAFSDAQSDVFRSASETSSGSGDSDQNLALAPCSRSEAVVVDSDQKEGSPADRARKETRHPFINLV